MAIDENVSCSDSFLEPTWSIKDRATMTEGQIEAEYPEEAPGELCKESLDMIYDSFQMLAGAWAEIRGMGYTESPLSAEEQKEYTEKFNAYPFEVKKAADGLSEKLFDSAIDPKAVFEVMLLMLEFERGKSYNYSPSEEI